MVFLLKTSEWIKEYSIKKFIIFLNCSFFWFNFTPYQIHKRKNRIYQRRCAFDISIFLSITTIKKIINRTCEALWIDNSASLNPFSRSRCAYFFCFCFFWNVIRTNKYKENLSYFIIIWNDKKTNSFPMLACKKLKRKRRRYIS